jgi:hypothetical protein
MLQMTYTVGKDITFDEHNHSSLDAIHNNVTLPDRSFEFKHVDVGTINKIVNKIGSKKVTGVDTIPAKLLKAGSPAINPHICELVNQSISTGAFPDRLKQARQSLYSKRLTLYLRITISQSVFYPSYRKFMVRSCPYSCLNILITFSMIFMCF